MEFGRVDPPRRLEHNLYLPGFGSTSTGAISLVPAGNSARVTWTNAGKMASNPLMHWFGLMMDKMVGPDFEGGLKNLKAVSWSA